MWLFICLFVIVSSISLLFPDSVFMHKHASALVKKITEKKEEKTKGKKEKKEKQGGIFVKHKKSNKVT